MTQEDLAATIAAGRPISWKMNSITDESYITLRKEFSEILDTIHREDLKVKLDYCLREFCVNSLKAMIKRLFFKTHNGNIEDPEDYARLMANFREAWTSHIDVWERRIKETESFYQVNVQCKDGLLNLIIANPGKVLPAELERINQQIKAASSNDSEGDFYFGLGDAEGGGLGLLLIGRMLQSFGCASENLSFWVYQDKTVFMLRLPLDRQEQKNKHIHAALAKEINSMPSFPETLLELQKQLSQPDLMITQMAEMVKRDAGLVALVLKTANSAAFMRLKKVTDISEALAFIGIKGLKALLLYHGVEKQFSSKYSNFEEVMEHSRSVAAMAGKLAKKFLPRQMEIAYVGGLLHDMGKIIILEHPTAFAKKLEECRQTEESSKWCLENLSFGLDHAELGGMVAERWNFPAELLSIIHYHHDLTHCPSENLPLTLIVYFADAAPQIASGEYPVYLLHQAIFTQFKLKSEAEVIALAKSII